MQEFSDWFDAKAQIQWTQEKCSTQCTEFVESNLDERVKERKQKILDVQMGIQFGTQSAWRDAFCSSLSLSHALLFFLRDLYVPERKQASKQATASTV